MKIENGSTFILKDQGGVDLKLVINQLIPDLCESIKFYLFGDEKMMGEYHDYCTPKQFLIDIVEESLDFQTIVKEIPLYSSICIEYSNRRNLFIAYKGDDVKADEVVEDQILASSKVQDDVKFCESVLEHLSCGEIIKMINYSYNFFVTPIYCIGGDPNILTLEVDSNKDLVYQIGYGIIDFEKLESENYDYTENELIELELEKYLNDEYFNFNYELWEREPEFDCWTLIEDSDYEFGGDDFEYNGMLETLGDQWLYAEPVQG